MMMRVVFKDLHGQFPRIHSPDYVYFQSPLDISPEAHSTCFDLP